MIRLSHRRSLSLILAAGLAVGSPASAQLSGLGGQGGLLGAVLPNVASAGVGNAAGVLGYCMKNQLLGGNGPASVLSKLTGRKDVKGTQSYAQGQKGLLQMDGSALSLGDLKGKVKSKVCSLVLQHAQSFL